MIMLLRDNQDSDYIYGVLHFEDDNLTRKEVQNKINEFLGSPLAYGFTEEEMAERTITEDEMVSYEYTVDDIIAYLRKFYVFDYQDTTLFLTC